MTPLELVKAVLSTCVILIAGWLILFLTIRIGTMAYFTAKAQAQRYTNKNKRIKETNESQKKV
jgi:hypothetical protein